MPMSAIRSVGDAIDATRAFMLPVSLRRWATLALVVLFMGTPGTPVPANPQFFDPVLWRGPSEAAGGEAAFEGGLDDLLQFELFAPTTWPFWLLVAVTVVLVGWLLYQVVGVLMRFVLVEALSRDAVRLRADGRANLGNSVRVVAFRLGVGLLAAPIVLALGSTVAPFGPVTVGGWAVGLVGVALAGVALFAWLLDAVTVQFVVPVMVRTESGVLASWRRFWPVLVGSWTEYVAFGLIRAALGVAVGVAAAVGFAVALALGGVLVVTVGAIVVAAAGGLSGLGAVGLAVLAVLLLLFAAYAVVAYGVVTVPFQVYLWTYALLVLGDTDDALDLVPAFRAQARAGDARLFAGD